MNFSKIDKENYNNLVDYLKSLGDEKYKKFHSSIVKDTKSEIIGVRLPVLRGIAKNILKGDFEGFLKNGGKTYYEEVMLRGRRPSLGTQISDRADMIEKNFDFSRLI